MGCTKTRQSRWFREKHRVSKLHIYHMHMVNLIKAVLKTLSRRVCNNTIIIVLEGVVSSHQEEQIQEGQAVDMEVLFMVTKEVSRHSATATEGIKL